MCVSCAVAAQSPPSSSPSPAVMSASTLASVSHTQHTHTHETHDRCDAHTRRIDAVTTCADAPTRPLLPLPLSRHSYSFSCCCATCVQSSDDYQSIDHDHSFIIFHSCYSPFLLLLSSSSSLSSADLYRFLSSHCRPLLMD